MNLIEKIGEAQTVAELTDLERRYNLTDLERDLLFEKIEIMSHLLRWEMENERYGIAANLTDSWTPEQRQSFMKDWRDDELLLHDDKVELASGLTDTWTPEQRRNFSTDWQNDES